MTPLDGLAVAAAGLAAGAVNAIAGAGSLLTRNLLVYGAGGIVAPFVGIKLIDLLITALGLV